MPDTFEIVLINGSDEVLTLTFQDKDANVKNITGTTLTGTITLPDGTTQAVDGTLTLVTPSQGIFTWTPGTNDKALSPGLMSVQFLATDGSAKVTKSLQNRLVAV